MPHRPFNELKRSTLLALMSVFFVGYFGSILTLGQETAIELGNMILFSLAIGIVTAYTTTAWGIFRYSMLDGATVLSIGIWLGWLSISYRTAGAVLWRFFDKPEGWLDSALWGLHILGTCCSAICHLLGPESMNGRVPTKEWVRIGVIVAGAMMLAGTLTILSSGR